MFEVFDCIPAIDKTNYLRGSKGRYDIVQNEDFSLFINGITVFIMADIT